MTALVPGTLHNDWTFNIHSSFMPSTFRSSHLQHAYCFSSSSTSYSRLVPFLQKMLKHFSCKVHLSSILPDMAFLPTSPPRTLL